MSEKSAVLNQCQKITREFINNPLCMLFVHPLTFVDKKSQLEYTSKIKEQMDLQTVNKKLKDNCYSNLQEWAYDMYLIFNNAILFNDETSIIGGAAVYLRKRLDKRIRQLEAMNLRNYEDQLIQLGKRLENILKDLPLGLNVELREDLGTNDNEDFTISRITELQSALTQIASQGRSKEIIAVLKEVNPDAEYSEVGEIDLSHLGRNSLLKLESFVQNQNK
ncbi:Bromodomain containing protein [Histomonas meleagridis]|uniref:Bromodomain containing protein n=1 Tax=Histomonas meleagridis TaxID=135588 RepID=UPI0035595A7F|nr:Bromodomain containing protein [Histomonas meleagridis]KAH0799002.1 Bromodomain containing protein [Histomonas meleagridis]